MATLIFWELRALIETMKFLLPLFVLDLCLIFVDARTLCKDMNNEEVDWFVFYKMPKQTWSSDANVAAGTGFIYLDSNNKKWQQQTVGLDSLNQAIAYTMQAYYNNPSNNRLFHVLYNDEIPDSTVWSDTSGHTKGAAVFDTLYGFWLIHSLPRFLNNASYEFPSNAHRYGQAGICVSLNYEDSFPNLAMQLYNTNPFIYSSFLPPKMEYDAPLMRKVLNGQRSDEEPYYSVNSFICTNGASFKHFAKEESSMQICTTTWLPRRSPTRWSSNPGFTNPSKTKTFFRTVPTVSTSTTRNT
ncbi:hypothetical protein L596_018766 [Steinernema carpocapsae]|uniref:Uncharacterized protein n=1 Tax=Steinernema carpocapsae TaxID=34508 RepID=A0A4U5N5M1_STECR|nr:hypothetical protein L596_018766 [Steinernema carpocapsae]